MRKFYKKDDQVYEFEADGSQDFLITSEYVRMTEDEVEKHLNYFDYLPEDERYAYYLYTLKPLTRRQFRLVLVLNGYDLDQIKLKILEIPNALQRQVALIEWDDANNFERKSETLLLVAGLLGISENRINELWEQAMTL